MFGEATLRTDDLENNKTQCNQIFLFFSFKVNSSVIIELVGLLGRAVEQLVVVQQLRSLPC